MRKIVFLVLAQSVLSFTANTFGFAADLPARGSAPPIRAPAVTAGAARDWTGCYLGANAGGGWSHIEGEFLSPVTGSAGKQQDSGFLGGGQVGCDYQLGSIVLGARGLRDWSSLRGHHVAPAFPDFVVENRIPWIATVVGRMGFLIERTSMLYVVGGAAWKRNESQVLFTGGGSKLLFEDATSTREGWLVGAGYESLLPSSWWLGANWSWFVEYNYMDFGKKNVQFTRSPLFGGPFPDDLIRIHQTSNSALLGLNRRFNWSGPM